MDMAPRTLTADQLLLMPDHGHYRYELVKGVLNVMEPAGAQHGSVAMEIAWRLMQHVGANGLGKVFAAETGFKIRSNPDTVRAPDAAFVRQERIEQTGIPSGFWPGAPDLAVEVVSPSDSFTEVDEKVVDWLSAGTRLVIVVDPRTRTATVHRQEGSALRLRETDLLRGEEVVPGWSVVLSELFPAAR
jgi:Uma2 family endonuclease